jgi:hypothetical protein
MIKSTLIEDLKDPMSLKKYYRTDNLKKILRHHEEEDVTDYREITVRASFDALIKFCAKLEYLKDIHLLKKMNYCILGIIMINC